MLLSDDFDLSSTRTGNIDEDCMLLSCQVRISEWIYTLYLPECQELLARNRCDIWSLSNSNGSQTHNNLVRKRTINHLAKLPVWVNGWVCVYQLSGWRLDSLLSLTKITKDLSTTTTSTSSFLAFSTVDCTWLEQMAAEAAAGEQVFEKKVTDNIDKNF